MLEPYQIEGVRFLRKHKGGCLWDDPGLGKTRQAIVAAAHRTPVLVVCPSTLRAWWEEEIKTIYPDATVYVAEVGGRIGGADVDKLPVREWTVVHYTGLRLALEAYRWVIWGAVICDECFPWATPVLTDHGPLPIGMIVDRNLPVKVLSCDLSSNVLEYKGIKRRIALPRVHSLVRVVHGYGELICTANHKLWTEEEGYVEARNACDLTMRVVWNGVHGCTLACNDEAILRKLLRREVANAAARDPREDLHKSTIQELVCRIDACTQNESPMGRRSQRTYEARQSDAQPGDSQEGVRDAESCGAWPSRAWWEWNYPGSTTSPARRFGRARRMGRVSGTHWPDHRQDGLPADVLQGRPCISTEEIGYRSRWSVAQYTGTETPGPKEGAGFASSGVVCVEVLESGGLREYGCCSTVYNLEVEDHHNYIANGVLVSNCHYIKNAKAKRTKAVKLTTPVDAMRIALTATPFSTLVADLWAQLAWVSHEFKMDYLGYWPFYDEFVQYTRVRSRTTGRIYRKPEGIRDKKALATLMAKYGLHRSNERVMPTQDMPLLLEGRQAVLYGALKKRVEVAIRDSLTGEITGVLIRNALARLLYLERCLSCPWTLDSGVAGVKLQWVKEWAEGYPKPAVIVARFKASANRIAKVLGITAVTGDVKNAERNEIISSWQAGKQQFLVGTIHTLGTGLNLDRGWAMVFYDSVWSPILMAQARDRINRMTTDHPIQALYLYVKGTTSELVLRSWQRSWDQRRLVMEFLELLKGDTNENP